MARVLLLRGGATKTAKNSVRFYQVFINRNKIDTHSAYSLSRSRVFRGSRELSSSCVLHSRDEVQRDSELLRETPTFESELTTSGDGVVNSGNTTAIDLLTQTEDFAALGLGGYTPPGLVQTALEFIHNTAHLPWWVSIVAATVALRLTLFPLAIRLQVNAAKLANINPLAQEMHKRMAAYKNIGNKVAEAQEAAKLLSLYRQHGVNPITSLLVMPLVQIPIFISFFLAIKRMANLPLVSMKTGGIYWFTDLTVPDPTYFLPLLACLTFLSNVEVRPSLLVSGCILILGNSLLVVLSEC